MGTWGIKPFDNDSALDWASDVESATDIELINTSFQIEGGDIDADDGVIAVTAALIVASAINPLHREDIPDNLFPFIDKHTSELQGINADEIVRVLTLIQDEDVSELAQLWKENEEAYSIWNKSIQDIIITFRPR
jgi:hypothetical protein